MPLRPRFQIPPASWTLLASVAGLLCGRLLALGARPWASRVILLPAHLIAQVSLATGSCLAIALLFASIVIGADGLEPMRGVGRVAWKTGAWIAGSSGVAVGIGLLVGVFCRPDGVHSVLSLHHVGGGNGFSLESAAGEPWVPWVLVAVAFGIYRNQIEESQARLLLRLALAVDEALTLLLDGLAWIVPVAVFCVALNTAATLPWAAGLSGAGQLAGLAKALALGWGIYGLLLLPLVLFVGARVPPWRYARVVGPALAAALAGANPNAIFALTLDRVRAQAGISNRVGSVALGGCTALLRDGQALGYALTAGWLFSFDVAGTARLGFLLSAWLFGCAGGLLGQAMAPLLLMGAADLTKPQANGELLLLTVGLIGVVGNAVSVFSHTCAAAVIAHSEGEKLLVAPSRS